MVRNGHYLARAYLSSFIGILPLSHPRIAILVAVTNPTKKGTYGNTVAAPAFREIARQSMGYLRIPPDARGDYRDGANPTTFANWKRQYGGEEMAEVQVFEDLADDALRAAGGHRHRDFSVMCPGDFHDRVNRFDLRHQRQVRLLLLVRDGDVVERAALFLGEHFQNVA